MGFGSVPNLRAGHRQAIGQAPDSAPPSPPEKTYTSVERLFQDERAEMLKNIPPWIIKKAWFALAHLPLSPQSTIVDMGCRGGTMAYVMAVLAPGMHFIGVDKNADTIAHARETYDRPNLEFRCGDALHDALPAGSVDAIICNFILHEIFSNSDFNQRQVRHTLRQCQTYLRPGGLLLVRDFAEPHDGEQMVYLEMPDTASRGDGPEQLSEPDLLVWYSEQATMRDDPARSGFYLEELPARFPRTRLFRLPHKWAYEFVMRKDRRDKWQVELPKEYTFYDERDYHRSLNSLGLRVLYSAPHWDEAYIKRYFENRIRLLDESYTPLGHPPTSFVVLAQKVDLRDSLLLTERRKTKNQETQFNVTTYRNEADGRLIEIVSRNMNTTEILPFSILENNQLVVYLHEGVPRGLVNSVPRGGKNLDGKFWSGHLTEAISLDTERVTEIEEKGAPAVVDFMRDALGLRVSMGQSFVAGPGYFPNARFIAERVETRFVQVEPKLDRFVPDFVRDEIRGFASTGAIRAFDAQSIVNAISVGAIPSGNLEMQLTMLFAMLEIRVTSWADSPLSLKEDEPPKNQIKVSDILKRTATKDNRYKEIRGGLGKIKVEKSIFVDEGVDEEGGNTGLAARDIDFVVNEQTGMNVAVILPLSKQQSGEVMAGLIVDYMPIPQRYSGTGEMVTLPTINLPREIQNMEMAKKYVADKFEIKLDQISKMGEPYFTHVGVTPQRIFPFAINCPHSKMAMAKHGVTGYAPIQQLAKLHWKDLFERYDIDMLKVVGRVNKRMFHTNDLGIDWGFDAPLVDKYASAPFTTGNVVKIDMPLSGATPSMPATSINPLPAQIIPSGAGAGLSGFRSAGKKGDTRGSGGKAGGRAGGGARSVKPTKEPEKKKPNLPTPKPE